MWKKGESGNPGGKPKGSVDLIYHIRRAVTRKGRSKHMVAVDIAQRLVEIAAYSEDENRALQASTLLLNRLHGMPSQHVSMESTHKAVHVFLEAAREIGLQRANGNNVPIIDENIATPLLLGVSELITEQDQCVTADFGQ